MLSPGIKREAMAPPNHDEEQAPLLTTLARTNSFSGVVDDERIVTTPLAATGMAFAKPRPFAWVIGGVCTYFDLLHLLDSRYATSHKAK